MMQPKIKDKTWNQIWQCPVCERWHPITETMNLVSFVVGFAAQGNVAKPNMALHPVDDECFKKLELKEDKPLLEVPPQGITIPAAGMPSIKGV